MNIQPPDHREQSDAGPARAGSTAARGNIYLSRETCDSYLAGVAAVAVLSREDHVMIVPLAREAAGGMLLKIRNTRGDRVIHAQEFFRARGLVEDWQEHPLEVRWSAEAGALVVSGIPKITEGL
jgi:hypothetical protein